MSPMTNAIIAALALAALTGAAQSQSRGRSTMRAARSPDDLRPAPVVTNYDARGRVVSRETTSGNRTTIYDASGRNVGRVTTNR